MEDISVRVAARFILAEDLNIGETFENEAWRIHRYRPSIKITELANAGKRGKQVRQIDLYDLDYGNLPVEGMAAEMVMLAKRGANFDRMLQAAKEHEELGAKLQVTTLRGVDVVPGGFKPIKINGKYVEIESGYNNFVVRDKVDQNNLPTCIPATKGGKKSIFAFYRWVKDNQSAIANMTFRDVLAAMRDNGIENHQYCAMD